MTTRNTPSKNLLPKGQHDRNSAQVSAYDDNASEAGGPNASGPNSSGFSYLSENGLKNSTEERCEHVLSVTNVNVAARLFVKKLEARKGECIHIIGPNGAGKSTLLLTLAGLINPDAGEVSLYNKPMSHWTLASLSSVRTVLAQHSESSFHLTVKEYLSFYTVTQQRPFVPALLEKALEVSGFLDKILTQLSGGERQRVEICRALLQIWSQLERGEGIVLLDEPLQGLDIRHQYALASFVKALCVKGNTILMTSHDIALSANYSDSLWIMRKGEVFAAGEPRTVATQNNLEKVFECHFAISKHDNFLEIQVCAPISL